MVKCQKIAVCGQSENIDNETAKKAREIGKLLAEKGHTILTGGCYGYPYESAKGAFSANGTVIAYSPAKTLQEHVKAFNYPDDYVTEFVFTGLGVPGRNFPLVMDSDRIIIIGGKAGTLIEFAIAFHEKKIIGVLADSNGITPIIKELAEICDRHGEKLNIIYDSNPENLVKKVIS